MGTTWIALAIIAGLNGSMARKWPKVMMRTNLQEALQIFLPIVSLALSVCALTISFLTFIRDRGKLSVSLFIGDVVDTGPLADSPTERIVYLGVVNVGRRAIMLESIGWERAGNTVMSLLLRRLPARWRPTEAVLVGYAFSPFLFDLEGQPKVVAEGQKSTVSVSYRDARHMCQLVTQQAGRFYIRDTTGKRHFLPRSRLKKFKDAFRAERDAVTAT